VVYYNAKLQIPLVINPKEKSAGDAA